MPSTLQNRRRRRNVRVFDALSPPSEVAGFIQHGSISIKLFYECLNELIICNKSWLLFPRSDDGNAAGQALRRESVDVTPQGNYIILQPDTSTVDVAVSDERHFPRTWSLNISSTHTPTFTSRVRDRDQRCCVSGEPVDLDEDYFGEFHVAHIYPIAHADVWNAHGMNRWILDDAPETVQGLTKLNSVQNGLLLRSDVHTVWDDYLLGVNVDDDYRIVSFGTKCRFDGHRLYINPDTSPKYQPSPHLLKNHFRQCVLANMKGAGGRDDLWDHEDTHDLSQTVWQAYAGGYSRLQLELAARLGSEIIA